MKVRDGSIAVGTAILLRNASNARITDLDVLGNILAIDIDGGSVESAFGDTADGIRIEAGATDTVIRSNIAFSNGDDGIDSDSPSTRLIRNLANDNGDLGIEALPGTFGSENLASGNGNPLQCTGVTCE